MKQIARLFQSLLRLIHISEEMRHILSREIPRNLGLRTTKKVAAMSYLAEFQRQLENQNFPKFIQLWEEYCVNDEVDSVELKALLEMIKGSDLEKNFGKYAETVIPLWQTIKDEKIAYEIIRLVLDIQNTNTPNLANIASELLKAKYGQLPQFNEWMRLVGLRSKTDFQGCISRLDLLAHMKKGNYVFHQGGWGAGEIVDVSAVREQLVVEFENVGGRKDLSFANAFKVLIPLQDDHFLVRRFARPDELEEEAQKDPVGIIKLLLRDIGPKSAAEIKDELCGLVIDENDWTKWWQGARAKIKKDTIIETPAQLRDVFRLRTTALTHEERFQTAMQNKDDVNEIIQTTYNYARDYPDMLKAENIQATHKERLLSLIKQPNLTLAQKLQISFLLDNLFDESVAGSTIEELIKDSKIADALEDIEIIALKRRALSAIRQHRKDWGDIFLKALFTMSQHVLRDYVFKELLQSDKAKLLEEKLAELVRHPEQYPEVFVWYFQKIISEDNIPYGNKEGQCTFLESFLILFNILGSIPAQRDLVRKMYNLLSGKRYAIVRSIIEGTSLNFLKELLLLVSKCQALGDHDVKILRSLAAVVQPSLAEKKQGKDDALIIWTTEEGFRKVQERIQQIGTTEIVENAREIEVARGHGDLRENAEYKSALEKRSRLQGELKLLSDQINRARIITKEDISAGEVGVGSIVDVIDSQNNKITYTILGPWDANPDQNILSLQTKLVQSMIGLREGDHFQFRDEDYEIIAVRSYFDKECKKA